jgi:hypothetical protein
MMIRLESYSSSYIDDISFVISNISKELAREDYRSYSIEAKNML